MSNTGKLAMIAAVGPDLELGSGGDLIWHISADLKRFKQLTLGHSVIMGRKTWESLPKRPLPRRKNIVVSHSLCELEEAMCVTSPEDAMQAYGDDSTAFVMGGEQIYRTFLPMADVLYLTKVEAKSDKKVDCWFPEYREDWTLEEASDWETDPNGIRYRFETWVRK